MPHESVLPEPEPVMFGRYKSAWLANRALRFQMPSPRYWWIENRPDIDPDHPFVLFSVPWRRRLDVAP